MSAPAKVLGFFTVVLIVVGVVVMYRYEMPPFSSATASDTTAQSAAPATEETAPTAVAAISKETPTQEAAPTAAVEVADDAPVQEKAAAPAAKDLAQGQKLYEQYCVLCHGATGASDTPAGQAMGATSLVSENFKANSKKLPPHDYILQVIQEGVPGTPMVSFKGQIPNEADQKALTDYVVSLKK